MAEELLVNFWEAHNVGHVVEGLRYALGYAAANPGARVGIVLNAAAPVELAAMAGFLDEAHPVAVPGYPDRVGELADQPVDLSGVPVAWDRVLDNPRRAVAPHAQGVPGFLRYYAAADAHLRPRVGRSLIGDGSVPYLPHQQLSLTPPPDARRRARALRGTAPVVAVIPSGSGEPSHYPSVASWEVILAALGRALPGATLVLIGRIGRSGDGGRTHTRMDRAGFERLLAAAPGTAVDAVDLPLADQLALIEAADVLVAPHTGMAFLAGTVGTPWLAISGGRWPEWFFNGVPVLSVLPDRRAYPWFSRFDDVAVQEDDDGEGLRTPSMSRARILDDLDAIAGGAAALARGDVDHDAALAAYFPRLLAAAGGDTTSIFSHDDIHLTYL